MEKKVNGMNKEQYIAWRMDTFDCRKDDAERAWNRLTEPVKDLTTDEFFESMRNAYLY